MWERELHVAEQAAKEAGDVLKRLFGQLNHIMKKGEIDLVTEADFQAEKIILEIIGHHFPEDSVLAEETGVHERASERTWLVDPLDGTVNYAHGFPFFAVSIALEVEREVVMGFVLIPSVDESFQAVKGRGAFLNKRPITVSETRVLGEALLATGFPYDVHERPESVMSLFKKMLTVAQGIRRPGSAAIDLCYVAAGRFDGFWEERLKPWDTAAGMIILQEAGGKLSTFEGEPYSPYRKSIVAANPHLVGQMLKIISNDAPEEK
jgi:myo-inositol-1(or 4)-monophosphatase